MTQPPPPPPNQPPQGGFGPPPPPQDAVPQPGYGYPQAPQAPGQPPQAPQVPPQAPPPGPPQPQPGYGYPQQPPPANPGYGYPTHQQGAYGQQPGYGYPGQPTMPMHPQPPQAYRKFNAQMAIIAAAAVAVALIIGGGVWYSKSGDSGKDDEKTTAGPTGGGGDTGGTGGTGGGTGGTSSGGSEKVPADPASDVLFKLPMPVVKKDDSVGVQGSWVTDKAYVKTGVNEITGYDPAKGTKLWSVKLPGPVCEASRFATEDYRTAILFQASPAETSRCDQIGAIDLAAGKQLWTKTVTSGDYAIDFDNVTVSANTVALGSTDGGAAFDIDSGKVLWSPKPADTCYDAGLRRRPEAGRGTQVRFVRQPRAADPDHRPGLREGALRVQAGHGHRLRVRRVQRPPGGGRRRRRQRR